MDTAITYLPAIGRGLITTIWIALCSVAGAAAGALLLGPMRVSQRRWVRWTAIGLIETVRGASALVLLFWVFYALPLLPGMPHLSPLTASIAVLAMLGASYGAEIVRAGIEAVGPGQAEAGRALGLTPFASMRLVILPQALSQIVPAFGSLAADMVKWTSIVSFVGVQDLLYVANTVRNATYQTVAVFSALAGTYWLLCLASSLGFRSLERLLPLNRALRAVCATAGGPQIHRRGNELEAMS